jgi:hypothetical protein
MMAKWIQNVNYAWNLNRGNRVMSKELRFSQKCGFKKVEDILQVKPMNKNLKTGLWFETAEWYRIYDSLSFMLLVWERFKIIININYYLQQMKWRDL